jgi:hypothetical protein
MYIPFYLYSEYVNPEGLVLEIVFKSILPGAVFGCLITM